MKQRGAQVAGVGWSGTAGTPNSSVDLGRPGTSKGFSLDPENLARVFPGRWNPRRELPVGLGALVSAFAIALEDAGWWEPGQSAPLRGGLILGSDSHSHGAAWRFARDLAEHGPAGLSPFEFLFSLPSSATALLGILFGLREYQSTVTSGGLSGVQALLHGIDLLQTSRCERLLVGAFSVVRGNAEEAALLLGGRGDEKLDDNREGGNLFQEGTSVELAVALCLSAREERGLPLIEECCILDTAPAGALPAEVPEIDPAFRGLAAPALLRVSAALCGENGDGGANGGVQSFFHKEPGRPGVGLIRIRTSS